MNKGLDTTDRSGMSAVFRRWSVIAQLVEQATVNRPVVGSSPTHGAIEIKSCEPYLLRNIFFSVLAASTRK